MKPLMITKNSRGIIFLVFLFFFLVMLASSGGHLDVWDGKGYFLLTENLVKHQSLILHPDLIAPDDGKGRFSVRNYFSWQHELRNNGIPLPPDVKLEPTASNGSPLLALLGVPFYIIAEDIHYSTVRFTSYFLNSLILALMSTVVFAFASDFYRSRKIGFALSLVAGVGSLAWPYVTSYFEQPLTALILISCLYFLFVASNRTHGISNNGQGSTMPSIFVKFSPALAGLFLGLQSFAHSGTIIIVPGLAIIAIYILRKNKGIILQFLVCLFFLIALQLYINEFRFGSLTEFGYGHAQSTDIHKYTEGLYGLLVSPGLGLITYFPLIALLPLSVYYLWRQNKLFCIAFLYAFFSLLIFYGTLPGIFWTGLGGWGPRYMITIIPVLALMSGSILRTVSSKFDLTNTYTDIAGSTERSASVFNNKPTRLFKNILKILFTTLAFSGFLVNLLGVLVWYQLGGGYGISILHLNQLPGKPANNYRYIEWNATYSPILLHWKVLTTDWWKAIRDAVPSYYGWTPCIPDNFLYCNFGILPSIAIIVATFVTGFAIINILFTTRSETLINDVSRSNQKDY